MADTKIIFLQGAVPTCLRTPWFQSPSCNNVCVTIGLATYIPYSCQVHNPWKFMLFTEIDLRNVLCFFQASVKFLCFQSAQMDKGFFKMCKPRSYRALVYGILHKKVTCLMSTQVIDLSHG